MNFLAHFHLSPPWPDALAGAYLGDFVRGPVDDHIDLPPMIRHGITLHRAIDGFTDSHPVWRQSTLHIAATRRRLAGIAIDVIYDHFLCRHWHRFGDEVMEDFVARCYECLLSRTSWMGEPARRGVRRMRQHDWLMTYRETEGIATTFRRMEQRSPVLTGLADASEDFRQHYTELEAEFLAYYPEVTAFARATWQTLQRKTRRDDSPRRVS